MAPFMRRHKNNKFISEITSEPFPRQFDPLLAINKNLVWKEIKFENYARDRLDVVVEMY
jgi:hypothetical protein